MIYKLLRRRAFFLSLVLAASLSVWGCDDDAKSDADLSPDADLLQGDVVDEDLAEVSDQTDSELDGTTQEDIVEAGPSVSFFEVNGDLVGAETFFDFPFPSDVRLSAEGTSTVSDIGNAPDADVIVGLLETARDHTGYPVVPVGWFRFSEPLKERSSEDVIPADATSPVLLIDIDPLSPERGRLIPTVAETLEDDPYTATNVLGVAPRPGFILEPNTTYAFVVTSAIGDAAEKGVERSETFDALVKGDAFTGDRDSETLSNLYADLWPTLAEAGVEIETVVNATVFTTGDVVTELFELADQAVDDYDGVIANLAVDPDDGADHDRMCEVLGTMEVPIFQQGDAPYNSEGLFAFDEANKPILVRTEEMPIVLTIPAGEMPSEGWPIVFYFHGSGGISGQMVDRGVITEVGGETTKGQGPAWVMADRGFAMAGSAHPSSPERWPDPGDFGYINLANPKMLRDTFRQGVIEQRLYIEAIKTLTIAPSEIPECNQIALPDGETAHRFNPEAIYAMGQSMGGMYTNMIGAVEPSIKAVVPTGAGGYWSYFLMVTGLLPAKPLLGAAILTNVELSHLHPVLHVMQTAYEVADPIVYTPRLAYNPLEGHPVRPIYQPAGKGDSFFPTVLYDAMAIAYRHQQAGEEVWDTMQPALGLIDRDGFLDYPVQNNQTHGTTKYTSVIVQFEGDGISDPHGVYAQLPEVKHQFGCFLETFHATGTAVVPALEPGSPCPLPAE